MQDNFLALHKPVVLPYLQGLVPHVALIVKMFFVNHQIKLFPGRLALRIFCRRKTCGPWLPNECPRLQPQLPQQINFSNVWNLLGLMYPKNASKVSLNQ
ncbi:hypothetical protein TNCV_3885171 [Trichonephila clavipes]|nr:hypothetical protein TNCV_3885171 [Trichonephila clavipes]